MLQPDVACYVDSGHWRYERNLIVSAIPATASQSRPALA